MSLVLRGDCSLSIKTIIEVYKTNDEYLEIHIEEDNDRFCFIGLDKDSAKIFLDRFMDVYNKLED